MNDSNLHPSEADVPRVLCLAGPTGSGKTALALRIAHEFNGEVVNADSRQVYRDFPIITAQPSPEEQKACPHHLYGYLPCQQHIDSALWARRALQVIVDITRRGKLALVVGGTGFYFQTLLQGLADIPKIPDTVHAGFCALMQENTTEQIYATLSSVDPEYASKIHSHDCQRILRALEVAKATGHNLSWWHKHSRPKPICQGPLLVADTPLQALEPGLRRRIETMLRSGALEEGKKALSLCPDKRSPGWSGIGCREVYDFLTGHLDQEGMIEAWYKNTRAYAKRQITWFRGRKESIWISLARHDAVLELCQRLLSAEF